MNVGHERSGTIFVLHGPCVILQDLFGQFFGSSNTSLPNATNAMLVVVYFIDDENCHNYRLFTAFVTGPMKSRIFNFVTLIKSECLPPKASDNSALEMSSESLTWVPAVV